MHRVEGVLKEYAWGKQDGLVPWHRATGGPQAELWFGTHEGGPAPLLDEPERTLVDIVDTAGLEHLPLVKLLAAGHPLSIQVHPDARCAAAGFAAQVGDPTLPVLYSDAAEKSEVVIALTDFVTHAGWRDRRRAAQVLIEAGLPDALADTVAGTDRVAAMRSLLELDETTRLQMLEGIIPAAIDAHWRPDEISALDRVATAFPGDPGVLVTVLLAHHRLAPGQALAVPAGVVHSYIEGLAVEVMTSSDNVLRLGLTPKTIAVDEALAAIRLDREPLLLDASKVIDPPGMPFTIEFIDADASLVAASGTARIVVALDDDALVDGVEIAEGTAGVISPTESAAVISSAGRAIVVTARVDQLPG